ncbi:hypothetical protein BD310DRAFT_259786 [Dichomitus squalens]|uniref:Uncharacterized protein n=1 Tax=Dichomitus squalens TaxID=114155 RepID=A0A4Q9PC40_9APHY|nr:hypothetical protein BD310DRAFT_259786 [Dichomitus squalens]
MPAPICYSVDMERLIEQLCLALRRACRRPRRSVSCVSNFSIQLRVGPIYPEHSCGYDDEYEGAGSRRDGRYPFAKRHADEPLVDDRRAAHATVRTGQCNCVHWIDGGQCVITNIRRCASLVSFHPKSYQATSGSSPRALNGGSRRSRTSLESVAKANE